jgi:hypothetical protein
MEIRRTNIIYSIADHPDLNKDEKNLVEKLSYLNPEIAGYWGRDEFRTNQVMRAYFRLEKRIKSKEELEEKLITERIIDRDDPIRLDETISQTKYGKMYFLASKEAGSKLAIYFINPKQ